MKEEIHNMPDNDVPILSSMRNVIKLVYCSANQNASVPIFCTSMKTIKHLQNGTGRGYVKFPVHGTFSYAVYQDVVHGEELEDLREMVEQALSNFFGRNLHSIKLKIKFHGSRMHLKV